MHNKFEGYYFWTSSAILLELSKLSKRLLERERLFPITSVIILLFRLISYMCNIGLGGKWNYKKQLKMFDSSFIVWIGFKSGLWPNGWFWFQPISVLCWLILVSHDLKLGQIQTHRQRYAPLSASIRKSVDLENMFKYKWKETSCTISA